MAERMPSTVPEEESGYVQQRGGRLSAVERIRVDAITPEELALCEKALRRYGGPFWMKERLKRGVGAKGCPSHLPGKTAEAVFNRARIGWRRQITLLKLVTQMWDEAHAVEGEEMPACA